MFSETKIFNSQFDNITLNDIMLKTKDACILKPDCKKGILVSTKYPKKYQNIPKIGLKSGYKLKKEGMDLNRSIEHNCIFFRAPYQKPLKLDYSDINSEINSVYPIVDEDEKKDFMENRIFIRVHPRYTYVFSSEIRDIFMYPQNYGKKDIIQRSRKSLLEYLHIIENNKKLMLQNQNKLTFFNLESSKVHFSNDIVSCIARKYPYNPFLIHKCSEVLVEIPFLSPEHFVKVDS